MGQVQRRVCLGQSFELDEEAKEATNILKDLIHRVSEIIHLSQSEHVRTVGLLTPEDYLRTYAILYNIFSRNSMTNNLGIWKRVLYELDIGVKRICSGFSFGKHDPGLRDLQDCWTRVDLFANCVQRLFPSSMANREIWLVFPLTRPGPFEHSYKAKDFSVDVAVLSLARAYLRKRKLVLEEGVLDLVDSARQGESVNLRMMKLALSLLANTDYNPLKDGEGTTCPIVLNHAAGRRFYHGFRKKFIARRALFYRVRAKELIERSSTSLEILTEVKRIRDSEINLCRSLLLFEFIEDHMRTADEDLAGSFELPICSELISMFQEHRTDELQDAFVLLRRSQNGLAHAKGSIAELAQRDWTAVLDVSSGSSDKNEDQAEHMNHCIERLSRVIFHREQTIMLAAGSSIQTELYETFLEGLSTALRTMPRKGLPIWKCAVLHVHDILSRKDLDVENDDARNRLRTWERILPVLPNKDLFLVDYRRKLVERALSESAQIEDENSALDLLMKSLDSSQVIAMYSMVNDLKKSESITRSWHEQDQSNNLCSLKILSSQNWTLDRQGCEAPGLMGILTLGTLTYLNSELHKRKLTFLPKCSSVTLEAHLGSSFEVVGNALHASILLLFNDRTQLSEETAASKLGCSREELGALTQRLPMIKRQGNQLVLDTDFQGEDAVVECRSADDFFDDGEDAAVPTESLGETLCFRDQTVQAAVMRVMKSWNHLGCEELEAMVVVQLQNWFVPDPSMIKDATAKLQKRDFLRHDQERNTYTYINC
ncbi:hypothetical protein NDN08_004134 [Rhodosorus marinus]|uniref:Cullin family profile domain-containing protein n=1 Tax=Rhodosorus marinus TaxID=101924 RepID=A0AAV8UL06_9RHOD|nr:hypothetical protein NDN08_004134 [Rhodosorus marinus]